MLSNYGSDSMGTPTAAAKRDAPFQQDNMDPALSDTEQPHAHTPLTDTQPSTAGPERSSVPSSKALPGPDQPNTGASVSAAIPGEEQTADVPAEAGQLVPPASVVQIMEKLVGFIKVRSRSLRCRECLAPLSRAERVPGWRARA